jgi:hypothetical protein
MILVGALTLQLPYAYRHDYKGHFDEDLDVFTVACAIVDSAGRWSIHIWRTTPIRE